MVGSHATGLLPPGVPGSQRHSAARSTSAGAACGSAGVFAIVKRNTYVAVKVGAEDFRIPLSQSFECEWVWVAVGVGESR